MDAMRAKWDEAKESGKAEEQRWMDYFNNMSVEEKIDFFCREYAINQAVEHQCYLTRNIDTIYKEDN